MNLRRSFGAVVTALTACAAATALAQSNRLAAIAKPAPELVHYSALRGHTNSQKVLNVSVSFGYRDPAGMQRFVDSVSNPHSRYYHAFITPQEVGERYGLPLSQIQAVVNYLKSNGMKVDLVAKNRLSLLAHGTVSQAEAAFHTTINDYVAPNGSLVGDRNFYSFTTPPSLPSGLAGSVVDIGGLENSTRPVFHQVLTPTQARTLYNVATEWSGGYHGEGRTVGISNWDGYRLSNVPLYYSQYGLPTPPGGVGSNITVVTISGGAGSGTPGAEGDLDIQMVLGMAPLCNLRIYDGGNSDLIGVLTQEANDNAADVITESYGWNLPAATATSAHNLHLSMSAQGITYMAATGDSGTSIEPYSYPDYEPEVLAVGGTVATTDSSGNRTSEVAWSSGGGGWSTNTATFNQLPSWQVGNGVPTTNNHRLIPDVALHASGNTTGAYYFYLNGSLSSGYVGTSFASPVFAGSLAVTEQKVIAGGGLPANGAGKQRFGRIQDLFYSQNGRSDVWHDITSGSNGTLPNGSTSNATAGWDYATGWGSIDFNAFAATQVSLSPDFSVSVSPSSGTVVQGGSTNYTTTVTALNGYTGTVNLSVSGFGSGGSGAFSPTSITNSGTSTLTASTTASATTGTYTLTITGSDGTHTHSTTATFIVNSVNPPDFTISATPSSRSITRGQSTTYTVTIGSVNGFSSSVSLSVSGLPSRTSATFSPSSVTGSGNSTLTVKTGNRTTRGTYTLTIKGTSGSTTHSTTVTLTVN